MTSQYTLVLCTTERKTRAYGPFNSTKSIPYPRNSAWKSKKTESPSLPQWNSMKDPATQNSVLEFHTGPSNVKLRQAKLSQSRPNVPEFHCGLSTTKFRLVQMFWISIKGPEVPEFYRGLSNTKLRIIEMFQSSMKDQATQHKLTLIIRNSAKDPPK